LLHNQLHPLLPDDNDDNTDDEGMGSRVFRAEGDDNIEINGPEYVPPEEDEELEPASDKDGGEIFDTNSEDDAYISPRIAFALELSLYPPCVGVGLCNNFTFGM
jgi:hypothetical protein